MSAISPSWVATEGMNKLDENVDNKSRAPLIYVGCHLQLRQIARALLRNEFEDDKEKSAQHELFPDLQWRYPRQHRAGEEPCYILLEDMTDADVEYNVVRLRDEGNAKLKHATALQAWNADRNKSAA